MSRGWTCWGCLSDSCSGFLKGCSWAGRLCLGVSRRRRFLGVYGWQSTVGRRRLILARMGALCPLISLCFAIPGSGLRIWILGLVFGGLGFGLWGVVGYNSAQACNRPCFHPKPPGISEVKTAHGAVSCFPFRSFEKGAGRRLNTGTKEMRVSHSVFFLGDVMPRIQGERNP